MRKSSLVVLSVAVVALLGWVLSSQAQLANSGDIPPGFGNKVAGCYHLELWIGPDENYGQGLVTLTADGNWIHSPDLMFAHGDPEGNKSAPGHGAWIRTGPRDIEVALTMLGFDYEGRHVVWWKAWVPFTFDEDFEIGICEEYPAAAYSPDQDPTDPNEEPLFEWTGYGHIRRIPG